jgi:hypothetical protein
MHLRTFALLAFCTSPAVAQPADAGAPPTSFKARKAHALQLYDAHDFVGCSAAYEAIAQQAPAWSRPVESVYNAACCAALAGQPDRAFALLDRLLGYGEPRQGRSALQDPDLVGLTKDRRWAAFEKKVQALDAREALDPRLKALIDADQAERQGPSMAAGTVDRDRARRVTLVALLDAGAVKSARDLLAASLLFQHGSTADEFGRANTLARKALALEPSSCRAQHMVAITEDRHLVRLGKRQKYGTQYECANNTLDHCVRQPVDPSTTDAERTALCVPPLAEQDETMK